MPPLLTDALQPISFPTLGSPFLACATAMNCLIKYYDLSEHIPLQQRPSLVLSAEQELGITAGLQDRVMQVGRRVTWHITKTRAILGGCATVGSTHKGSSWKA